MYTIEDIKKIIGTMSEDKIINAISKGALKLSDEQINTVSFIFWLCYLAERDLESVLTKPWELISTTTSPEVITKAKEMLDNIVFGSKKTDKDLENILENLPEEEAKKIRAIITKDYRLRRTSGIDNLEYFTDKILMYEGMFGKNNVVSILWEIKELRNAISHNKIDSLTYNGKDLVLRETKEKILIDYLEAVSEPDHSQKILEDKLELTDEDQAAIRKTLEQLGIVAS
jgi:hypothetical protein